jgi:hypothetical protein
VRYGMPARSTSGAVHAACLTDHGLSPLRNPTVFQIRFTNPLSDRSCEW